ncbi:MAG: OmpH family outer membrane protein [Thiopseudomonas sp.]|nr:OmpH family outer membrane protein [Thiopseudomonas sp.]
MRNVLKVALLSTLVMSGSAWADIKIAVLDYQRALLDSDAAKKYAVDAEKKFAPQLNKLKALETDAKRLQDRLMKDGEKMKQAEYERLELELKQKARDFQLLSQELNEAKATSDNDVLQTIKPKLDKAVEEVLKSGNYDLVIDRDAVIDVKPQLDITLRVIERMNQMR